MTTNYQRLHHTETTNRNRMWHTWRIHTWNTQLYAYQSINQYVRLFQATKAHITDRQYKKRKKKEQETMTTQTDRRETVQYDCCT